MLLLRGYGSADAAAVYARALVLDNASVSHRQRFEVLWGQWMVSSSRPGSSFKQSWNITRQLLQLARKSGNDNLLVQAYSAATNISLWRNQLDDACRSEEHTSELQSLMRISYAVFCLKKKNIVVTAHEYKVPSDQKT